MLASYSDATFVSTDYARELSSARTQPLDVDHVRDDPPERIAGWLASVGDAALRALDHALLVDLLVIEADPLRWRDMAETVIAHADDLVRVGYFDQAWELVEGVIAQGAASPARQFHATSALERFGGGAMMKHVAAHLRQAWDAEYSRFSRLCHAIGTAVITPLAEALTEEQDAHARLRLREILIGFGPRGRESVQQLMHSTNWEVRRTAAYLLREFGGAEGLKELIPLLTDPEPLVQREAVQGLVLNGSPQAADILLGALTRANAVDREALGGEILGVRDERGVDRCSATWCGGWIDAPCRGSTSAALDALGTSRAPDTVAALDLALRQRDWRTPLRNRRFRAAAAQSLRLIGTPAALDALRAAAADGAARLAARGARRAGRARLMADRADRHAGLRGAGPALRGGHPRHAARTPPDHPLVTRSMDEWLAAIKPLHSSSRRSSFGIIEKQLVVADTPLPRVSAAMAELIEAAAAPHRADLDRSRRDGARDRRLRPGRRRARRPRRRHARARALVRAHPGRPRLPRRIGRPAAWRATWPPSGSSTQGDRRGRGRLGQRRSRRHAGRRGGAADRSRASPTR